MDANAALRERAAVKAKLRCEAAHRSLLIVTIALAGGVSASAESSVVPAYQIGDVVAADVLAPFEFAVVNPDQTEKLRQAELAKVPAIYRFDPWIAVEAEEKLAAAFNRVRTVFVTSMEIAARKVPLDEATIAHPSFWQFVAWFTNRYPDMPVTTNLARAWALEESDDPIRFQTQTALREVMSRYIRADAIPARTDTDQVQLFSRESPGARPNLADLEDTGEVVSREEIASLSEARRELRARLCDDGEELAAFAERFVQENLTFDDWLTAQRRRERVAELVVFDQYSPGQIIARANQVVDSRAKAALDIVAVATKRQSRAAESSAQSHAPLGQRLFTMAHELWRLSQQHPALVMILLVTGMVVGWRVTVSRKTIASIDVKGYEVSKNHEISSPFLPVLSDHIAFALNSAPTLTPDMAAVHAGAEWQMQLREAEHRAEELLSLVRAGLAPYLAKELTRRLVHELISHRASLLRAHQLAAEEILALESRFEKVHHDLRERLSVYEQRTVELEKELASKTEQTRELLKAATTLTQSKIEQKPGKAFVCN
jgi:hypothetical protein